MSNYHVEFENLYFGYFQMVNNHNARAEASEKLEKAIKQFDSWNDYFVGMSADALKSYFENIHIPIMAGLSLLSATQVQLYQQYLADYCFRVDGDGTFSGSGGDKRAVFDSRELEALIDGYKSYNSYTQKTDNTETELSQILRNISDLFSCQRSNTEPMLQSYHNSTKRFITEIHDNIDIVESEHVNKDFVETEQMINSLYRLIGDVIGKSREFKSGFSEESLMEIKDSYNGFIGSANVLNGKLESIPKTKLDAFEGANKRFLQEYKEEEEERKRREEEAKKWKWAGVILGVAIGGAVIIASGGTATPVVAAIAGGLAAGTTAFCDSVADNIIENGDAFKNMNWGKLAGNVLINAGIGAVVGFAGGAAAQKVGDIGAISRMTHSTNFINKAIGNVATEGAKEITGGFVKRFGTNVGNSIIEGKAVDIKSAISDTFDVKEIGKDVVKGSTSAIVKSGTSYIKTDKMHVGSRAVVSGVKGTIEDGVTGAVKRGAGEIIDNGYSDKVWEKVIDKENDGMALVKDVGGGFVKGAAKEVVQVRQADINDKNVDKYKNEVIKDPKAWVEDGGTIRRTITGKLIYDEKQVYNTPKSKVGSYSYKNRELTPNKYIRGTSDYRPTQYNGYYVWPQGAPI